MVSHAIEFINLPDSEQHQMRALPPIHDVVQILDRCAGVADRMLDLPPHVAALITSLLTRLQDGERIAILSQDMEISAGDVSAILGLPVPLVRHRMETGDLPSFDDGREPRARLKDVLALKRKTDSAQAALDELAEETETLIRVHGL